MASYKDRIMRSPGDVLPEDPALVRLVRGPRPTSRAADMAALNRGESRTIICSRLAEYGDHPKRLRGGYLDLTPQGPVLRPGLIPRLWRRPFLVTDELLSAEVRPFTSENEAFKWGSSGLRSPDDGLLGWAAFVPVRCQTSRGILEVGVMKADVPLFLHYVELTRRRRGTPPPQGS
jgi:hypothetical protein